MSIVTKISSCQLREETHQGAFILTFKGGDVSPLVGVFGSSKDIYSKADELGLKRVNKKPTA